MRRQCLKRRDADTPLVHLGAGKSSFDDDTLLDAVVILFPSILTESSISSTTLCWIKRLLHMSSVGLALAGTVPCVVGCCYLWMLVSSLVNDLACGVLSCCRCLCFRSSSLWPPLSKELYVGTMIHTVPTASIHNPKVQFLNCIVQRVFFSRARGPYTFFCKE
jgi:hypothetical protein